MSRSSSVSELDAPEVSKKQKETMTINEVLAFAFPAGTHHSCTTNRLYLLGDNGPLFNLHSYLSCMCGKCQDHIVKRRKTDELCKAFFQGEIYDGETLLAAWKDWLCEKCSTHMSKVLHMRGGFKGKKIVNKIEINQMCQQIEKDDILNAYHRNHDGSTLEEQNQFLSLIKREENVKKACRNLTRDEIINVFKEYASGSGCLTAPMSYYDARKAINKHRAARVKMLGLMYPEKKKNVKKQWRPKPVPHAQRVGEVPGGLKLGFETRKVFGREEDVRLNHAHLFELATFEDQNNPGIVMNTRLLRNLNREKHTWVNQF
jgi:hypothetical protein